MNDSCTGYSIIQIGVLSKRGKTSHVCCISPFTPDAGVVYSDLSAQSRQQQMHFSRKDRPISFYWESIGSEGKRKRCRTIRATGWWKRVPPSISAESWDHSAGCCQTASARERYQRPALLRPGHRTPVNLTIGIEHARPPTIFYSRVRTTLCSASAEV